MIYRRPNLLLFAAVALSAPFVARPITVIEVSDPSGDAVRIHGWTQVDDGRRVGLADHETPFRMVVRGRTFAARFVTEDGEDDVEVSAVHKRAWIPLTRVGSFGSTVSLGGDRSHLHLETP